MPTLEILHGTIAVFNKTDHVIAIITQNNYSNELKVLSQIKESGAKISIISSLNKKIFKGIYDSFISLPKLNFELSALLNIIPCQWLAYHTSTALNLNPDSPRRLVKAVI